MEGVSVSGTLGLGKLTTVVIGDSVGTTDYFRLKRGAVLLKDMGTEFGALGRLLTLDSYNNQKQKDKSSHLGLWGFF